MTGLWRASYSMLAAAALGLVCVPDAGAQTMKPLPYTNVPIGLNFLIVLSLATRRLPAGVARQSARLVDDQPATALARFLGCRVQPAAQQFILGRVGGCTAAAGW